MIGELTPWYTRQKEYADSQIQQQNAAMGALKLDSLMKAQKDFQEMSAEEKLAQVANPTAPVTATKTVAKPTAVPTSNTEATPTTTRSSDGTPMPSFNTGTTSAEPSSTSMPSYMSTGKPEEAAPAASSVATDANKEAAPPAAENKAPEQKEKTQVPLLQEMKNSNVEYKASQDRVNFMERFADKLRKSGNLLAWQEASKAVDNAKTAMYDQQIKQLAVQDKFLDIASGPVYGYKKAMEKMQLDTSNPESLKAYQEASDKNWNAMKLDLQQRGIPTSILDGINSWQDRAQRAESFVNSTLSGKEQISLQTNEAKIALQNKKLEITQTHYQNLDNIAQKKQIFNQNKFEEKAANDLLKDSESDVKSLRMSLNTAITKEDRDHFRGLLSVAELNHTQLVKDLKTKAKADNIKWDPVLTAPQKEGAPAATTNTTTQNTTTNEAAPKAVTPTVSNLTGNDKATFDKLRTSNPSSVSDEELLKYAIDKGYIKPNAAAPSNEKDQLKADLEATKKQLAELKPLSNRLGGMLPDKVGGGAFEILGNYRKQKAESDKKRKELEDRIKAIEEKLKAS